MTPLNERANALREWQRAERSLRAAEVLEREHLYENAASDAYYACFHAARALLFTLGQEPRSHRGALHLLNVHFVLTGKLDPRFFALVSRSYAVRLEADYGSAATVSPDDAAREIQSARDMLQAVRACLANEGLKVD